MTGACYPLNQIRGQQSETPLCYGCQYHEQLYSVTEATSDGLSAIPFNYETGETLSPRTLNEVARRTLDTPPRPIIQPPHNILFNETCPFSLCQYLPILQEPCGVIRLSRSRKFNSTFDATKRCRLCSASDLRPHTTSRCSRYI